MNLSRRDALAALAATGVAGVAGATLLDGEDGATAAGDSTPSDDTATASDDGLAILVAVAETVYPAAVEGVDTFVETYVSGLPDDRQDDVFAVAADLDATARDWEDAPLADLGRSTRDRLLRDLGVDVADPDPDGYLSERIRFHLVNELLYAFYASPTGGRLVGIENPIAYPGGTESYQRASMATEDTDG
jgi:hypothetical protein